MGPAWHAEFGGKKRLSPGFAAKWHFVAKRRGLGREATRISIYSTLPHA
jgi:hypothetical protein